MDSMSRYGRLKRRRARDDVDASAMAIATNVVSTVSVAVAVVAEFVSYKDDVEVLRRWAGKVVGAQYIRREPSRWVDYYMGDDQRYPLSLFREVFRIPRATFFRLRKDLINHNSEIWKTRVDGIGRVGIRSDVKVMACLRILATDRPWRDLDDSAQMGKETIRRYFWHFCDDVKSIHGPLFLNRRPTRADLETIKQVYSNAGYPGCVGCVDCMKVAWKNFPYLQKGQYRNTKEGNLATLSIEAWWDRDMFIWSWFCGRPGTSNDKTVLEFSLLFTDVLTGSISLELKEEYTLVRGGKQRKNGYLLADGIYPQWAMFIRPITAHPTDDQRRYAKAQESIRKDIERPFGVLQASFRILRREIHLWCVEDVTA